MRNKEDWLIYEVSETDFMFWSDDQIEIPKNTNTKRYFYNQIIKRDPATNWSCGLFGSMWVISDLTWYEYNEEDIKRINKSAIDNYWLSIPWWMTMLRAVKCVVNDWNIQNPDKKIHYYRTTIWDKIFAEALSKWHSLAVWYKTSSEYYKDSQDNWIINAENFPKKWWHLVRTNFNDNVIKIDDNYVWSKKYNTYINNKIKELKNNWVYFPSAYLFLFEKTMKDTIKENIDLEWAKEMFDKWYWNGLNPRKSMSRQEVMTVFNKLMKDLQK